MTWHFELRSSVRGKENTYRLENAFIVFVRHPVPEWEVQSIIFSLSDTDILDQISSETHA